MVMDIKKRYGVDTDLLDIEMMDTENRSQEDYDNFMKEEYGLIPKVQEDYLSVLSYYKVDSIKQLKAIINRTEKPKADKVYYYDYQIKRFILLSDNRLNLNIKKLNRVE